MYETLDAERRAALMERRAAWRASLTDEWPEVAPYEAPAPRPAENVPGVARYPSGSRADIGVQELAFKDDEGKEVRMTVMRGTTLEQAREMHRQEKRRQAGRSKLAVAIDAGDAEAVRRLIAGGMDPQVTDQDSRGRPIGWIARAAFQWSGRSYSSRGDRAEELRLADAYAAIVKSLLAAGADPSMTWQDITPMQALPMRRQPSGEHAAHLVDVARALLERGATMERKAPNYSSPLATAAAAGHLELVEVLVRYGKPDQKMLDDALLGAVHQSGSGAVALLRLGADPNARMGSMPLLESAMNRGVRSELVRVLIERKVDPNIVLGNGQTPLMRAVRAPEILESLIRAGARVDATHATEGYTALHLAASSKPPTSGTDRGALPDVSAATRARSVEILLRHGAKVDAADKSGSTPLMWTSGEDGPAIEKLLDAGATLPARAKLSPSQEEVAAGPVTGALLRGNETLAEAWLRRHPRLSAADCAALYLAATRGATSVAGLLAKQKPATVHEPWSGHTPLIGAASNGHLAVVETLLAAGAAKVDERSEVERVHVSLGHGGIEMILAIPVAKLEEMEKRRRESGVTALMAAAKGGRVETVERLLRAGAKVDLADGHGWTALDHAHASKSADRQRVLELLEARGAKRSTPRS